MWGTSNGFRHVHVSTQQHVVAKRPFFGRKVVRTISFNRALSNCDVIVAERVDTFSNYQVIAVKSVAQKPRLGSCITLTIERFKIAELVNGYGETN